MIKKIGFTCPEISIPICPITTPASSVPITAPRLNAP